MTQADLDHYLTELESDLATIIECLSDCYQPCNLPDYRGVGRDSAGVITGDEEYLTTYD